MRQTADGVTQGLRDWIASVLPDVAVEIFAADDWQKAAGVSLRLLALGPVPLPGPDRAPRALRLDYLLTLSLDDPLAEHRCLGELTFAAMERPDYRLLAADEAAGIRRQFGVPAGAGLMIAAELRRERVLERAPLVRRPLVVQAGEIGRLEGVVLGPEDTPLADAIVELPALNLSAMTDHRGRFRFAGTPSGAPQRLAVTKNRVRVEVNAPEGAPVTIRIPLED